MQPGQIIVTGAESADAELIGGTRADLDAAGGDVGLGSIASLIIAVAEAKQDGSNQQPLPLPQNSKRVRERGIGNLRADTGEVGLVKLVHGHSMLLSGGQFWLVRSHALSIHS